MKKKKEKKKRDWNYDAVATGIPHNQTFTTPITYKTAKKFPMYIQKALFRC